MHKLCFYHFYIFIPNSIYHILYQSFEINQKNITIKKLRKKLQKEKVQIQKYIEENIFIPLLSMPLVIIHE